MVMIFAAVYSSFSLGIRTWKRVNIKIANNATDLLIPLTRQLRCAYLAPGQDPDFVFQGSLSAISFVSTAVINDDIYRDNVTDLQKVSCRIRADEDTGQNAFIYESYDILGENKENFKQIKLSNMIKSISFAFYDGEKWLKAWNSTKNLPQAVMIRADFQEGIYQDSFETVAQIHCANKGVMDDL